VDLILQRIFNVCAKVLEESTFSNVGYKLDNFYKIIVHNLADILKIIKNNNNK